MTATNVTLLNLIDVAYGFTSLTTTGPDWLNSDRFDVTAIAPQGVPDTELMPMLQALLEDRFQLKTHRESKEMSVYDMVIARGGLKISRFDGSHFPAVPPNRGGSMIIGALTMPDLAKRITSPAGRPVIDQTGLSGQYALTVTFTPTSFRTGDIAADATPPDLFTAMQEQLGLKLQPNRAAVEVLVVDHAERAPSEN